MVLRCHGVGGEQGSDVLGTEIWKKEQQKRTRTFVVVRFRDVPRSSHFLALLLPPEFSSVERDRNGPTSLRRGEGRLWVDIRGWERGWAARAKVGGSGRRK